MLRWTTVHIVSAFFLALYLLKVSSVVQASTSTFIQRSVGSACRGICVCLAALCHPSLPKLTEVRWQSFDVRKRYLLLAVSHRFTSVQPLTQSVIRSERVLCIFRSEQFANSFKNCVKQKELRYRICHRCF